MPTRLYTEPEPTPPDARRSTRRTPAPSAMHSTASHDSIDDARYVPGHIVAERYRIVGLLGRGGMGEVYRADDLKLGQPVALKFLPEALSMDAGALARFHREVRIARGISHANVCRVYDIGETGGQHFLSMEFIRGEELASVLRRFGRLPADKATEIARQICAGLAAAHKQGVLHRDLKPANVMIDADGNARITDFGLAALAEEIQGEDRRSGTPAYMSPEQLAGSELSMRSDIYSLGLVLYEIFTGRRAFEASTLEEILRLRRSASTPATPSSHVKDLDPVVERVILRCLEREPEKRPASALEVAGALPGGDPLAAALAAGETPSPEMVAAAPKAGALRPTVALVLFASVIATIALACLLSRDSALYQLAPLSKSPEVLRERAREIVRRMGYTASPVDAAHGILVQSNYLKFIAEEDASATRWEKLRDGITTPYRFWYRQSPRYLLSPAEQVTFDEPPTDVSGMVGLYLDTEGRLRYLLAVPPQREEAPRTPTPAPEWALLFREAGLDPANFRETASTWIPLHAYDARAAWEGTDAAHPSARLHVEAAAYRGRPVYFEVVYPWDQPLRQETPPVGTATRLLILIIVGVFMLALVGSALLALRNLRLGLGDRRGAFRLALFYFAAHMLVWLVDAHHVWTLDEGGEFQIFGRYMERGLFGAAFLWLLYVALEPFVRRRWPERIISWTRLLAGDFRDPLVGRDLLIGALFGTGLILSMQLHYLVPGWLGRAPGLPHTPDSRLMGLRYFTTELMTQITSGLALGLVIFFFLLLLFIITRRVRVAFALAALILSGIYALAMLSPERRADAVQLTLTMLFAVVNSLLVIIPLYRYGLLAVISAMFFFHLSVFFPITSDFSAWYAGDFVVALVVAVALAFYGFYTSLAGQKLFRGQLLPDS